jgi:hypothetical protein
MKSRLFALALAVTASIGLSTTVQAGIYQDAPITIGLNGGPEWLVRSANVSWIRGGYYWSMINPGPGQFYYGDVDNFLTSAHDNGLNILFILSGAPQWCGSTPNGAKPCDIESWKTFVDNLTQHIAASPYASTLGAFEIWNEPDLSYSNTYGVGWDQDFTAYPRYVDYMIEASRIIHRNMPWAKVVGPVLSGKRNDVFRLQRVFDDLENVTYYDPDYGYTRSASDYVDVISGHMDCGNSTHSEDAAYLYQQNVLGYIADRNPRNRYKEQWITEISWDADGIGQDSQRVREKNFFIEMTGGGYRYLSGWNFTQGFIYTTQNSGTGRSVYYSDPYNSAKLVVTNYLRPLGFPAIQQPGVPRE